jgi:uncharacterized protein (DUF433 family)
MENVAKGTEHPYVVSQKDLCGGSPVIRGTKFPVRAIVNYILHQGIAPEELIKEFTHLTLAHVYDALSYYYDHKESIDEELRDNSIEAQRNVGC